MRPSLNAGKISERAAKKMGEFHADIVSEVQKAVDGNKVVVVGMRQNPVVKKARKALTEAGVDFKYLEYGSYFAEWKRRLAIKLWSGWPTFPQVFVGGVLIGGCDETVAELQSGKAFAALKGK